MAATDNGADQPTTQATTPPDPEACVTKGIVPLDATTPTGSCRAKGSRFTIANQDGTLKTKAMSAQFESIRETASISSADGFDSSTASGTYVVVTVSLTNRLTGPASINSGQAALVLDNGKQYEDAFDAENGPDDRSFLWQDADSHIQPDETRSGDFVFDLPAKAFRRFNKNGGALVMANLGDDIGTTSKFGVLRLNAPQ